MDLEKKPNQRKDTVLYVDDDEFNLVLFETFMKEEYHVLTASSSSAGYKLIKEHSVKVLISDQRMPDETGLEFIERITPEYPDLVKIIFTAHIDHTTAIKAINQRGVYRYVMKPWNFQEMQQTLQNAISEFDLRAENKNLIQQLKSKNAVLEKAYLQIKESEKKFTGIFQASSDGMLLLKQDKIVEANNAFLNIAGLDSNDFSREKLRSFIEKEMPGILKYATENNSNNQSAFEYDFITSSQERKYLELNNRILKAD